jgi:hypothetical protein
MLRFFTKSLAEIFSSFVSVSMIPVSEGLMPAASKIDLLSLRSSANGSGIS